jgi:hypothetical protein
MNPYIHFPLYSQLPSLFCFVDIFNVFLLIPSWPQTAILSFLNSQLFSPLYQEALSALGINYWIVKTSETIIQTGWEITTMFSQISSIDAHSIDDMNNYTILSK